MTKGKSAKLFLLLTVLIFIIVLAGCTSPKEVLGTYSSPNNGSIEITEFDGEDGEFKAYGILLPRLNNGASYSTASNQIELFTVYRKNGDVYSFRASVNGVAYIGTFNSLDLTVTIENVVYRVQK